jgi:hypothetical protein
LIGLNVLNELNAPNDDNRASFFFKRGKGSRFPKTYFAAPVQKQNAQDQLPAKPTASTPLVLKNESRVWSKRKNNGLLSHKRFITQSALNYSNGPQILSLVSHGAGRTGHIVSTGSDGCPDETISYPRCKSAIVSTALNQFPAKMNVKSESFRQKYIKSENSKIKLAQPFYPTRRRRAHICPVPASSQNESFDSIGFRKRIPRLVQTQIKRIRFA